jgi:hypothetical protein
MIAGLEVSDWMGALEHGLDEVASGVFGCSITTKGRRENPPPGTAGAYLSLVGPSGGVQIGLASSPDGCQMLSRAMLSLEPGAGPLGAEEVADAVSEIVNILAGAVKARVRDRLPTLQLGLPTFFHGPAQPTEKLGVAVAEVQIGEVIAALLLLYPRRGA